MLGPVEVRGVEDGSLGARSSPSSSSTWRCIPRAPPPGPGRRCSGRPLCAAADDRELALRGAPALGFAPDGRARLRRNGERHQLVAVPTVATSEQGRESRLAETVATYARALV